MKGNTQRKCIPGTTGNHLYEFVCKKATNSSTQLLHDIVAITKISIKAGGKSVRRDVHSSEQNFHLSIKD